MQVRATNVKEIKPELKLVFVLVKKKNNSTQLAFTSCWLKLSGGLITFYYTERTLTSFLIVPLLN